jgi:hypothetical protein
LDDDGNDDDGQQTPFDTTAPTSTPPLPPPGLHPPTPRLPPVNSAHCETRLLLARPVAGVFCSPESDPRPLSVRRADHRAPPRLDASTSSTSLCQTLDSTFDLDLPPPTLGPLLRPSLPPREPPCRRLLRTVTPPPRALRPPASSSSSPVVLAKHSTARVSRPAALSTLRTGQSPQQNNRWCNDRGGLPMCPRRLRSSSSPCSRALQSPTCLPSGAHIP